MMDLLLKSLTEGNECYIQMDSVDDGGSGVFYSHSMLISSISKFMTSCLVFL